MNRTPIYLRDLKPEAAWDGGIVRAIEIDKVLREAYNKGDDIVVGFWLDHPLTVEQAEGLRQ